MPLPSQLSFALFELGADVIPGQAALQPDGKLLLAGTRAGQAVLARLGADGTPDLAFGQGGWLAFDDVRPGYSYGGHVAVRADGTIVATTIHYGGSNLGLFEIDADGQRVIDRTPADGQPGVLLPDGSVRSPLAGSFLLPAAGGAVVGASADTEGLTLTRLDAAGAPDRAFGDGGAVRLATGQVQLLALADQGGKLLVAGLTRQDLMFGDTLVLARLGADGQPDAGFGPGGIQRIVLPEGVQYIAHVAVQPDGRIVAVGHAGYELVVLRYTAEGQPDASFDGDGLKTLDFGTNGAHFRMAAMAVEAMPLADGDLLVYGSLEGVVMADGSISFGRSPIAVRLDADGRLDTGYGELFYNVRGTAGDDRLEWTSGKDFIDGGAGDDTLVVRAPAEFFQLQQQDGRWLLTDARGGELAVTLKDVEAVEFGHGTPYVERVVLEPAAPEGGVHRIAARDGNHAIQGTAGLDLLDYDDVLSAVRITRTATGYEVDHGSRGTDSLAGIERLEFNDKTVNLTIQQAAGRLPASELKLLEELYVAFFNRVPDADGLEYWIGARAGGMDIAQIADAFYGAGVQYASLTGFSADMGNADFVDVVYRNVLGRGDGADPEALAFWTGQLASGAASRGSLVSAILQSAHTFKGDAEWGILTNWRVASPLVVTRTVLVDGRGRCRWRGFRSISTRAGATRPTTSFRWCSRPRDCRA